MIDGIIQWFNVFPSRKYALLGYLMIVVYAFLYLKLKESVYTNKRYKDKCKRFVYCNAKKSEIVYIEMVTPYVFDNYMQYVGYGVIDRNNQSIYFDVAISDFKRDNQYLFNYDVFTNH